MALKNIPTIHPVMMLAGLFFLSVLQYFIVPDIVVENVFFHSAIEGVGSVAAILTGIILLQKQSLEKNNPLRWVIAGLFTMGFLDGFHSISPPGNDFVLFHSSAVFFGGLFFSLSWLPEFRSSFEKWPSLLGISGGVLLITLTIIFLFPETVLVMLDQGKFTLMAKSLNTIGGFSFLIGAFYFYHIFKKTHKTIYYWIMTFSFLLGIGGVDFVWGEIWTSRWWIWHLFRLLAFSLVLFFVIIDHQQNILALKRLLHEKETLLRELYHRTKNNMQVVVSMINLQTLDIKDKNTLQIFKDTKNRIHTMALVHEKLYETHDLSRIDLKVYFNELIDLLNKSYKVITKNICFEKDLNSVFASIDSAIPCGLIVNELVSNSIKYAFEDNKGTIRIRLEKRKNGGIYFSIEDNGKGLPNDFDIYESTSMGFRTVLALAEHQLDGRLKINSKNGSCFSIQFKEQPDKLRV